MRENWCASCAAKDQEIADLKRKTQATDEQLLELGNTATEATEAWNSWEHSCEQKDAEIADLKRQLSEALALNKTVICSWCGYETTGDTRDECIAVIAKHISRCGKHPIRTLLQENERLTAELAEARKDTERLDWITETGCEVTAHSQDFGDLSKPITKWSVGRNNLHGWFSGLTLREAIDVAREGR